jgi:hypothetical protein
MTDASHLRGQLAALCAAEAALWRAVDAIHRGHPGLAHPPRSDQSFDQSTARICLLAIEDLLASLHQHRVNVAFIIAEDHDRQAAWPF